MGNLYYRLTKSCGCLRSQLEVDLFDFVRQISPDAILNTRSIIPPLELDVWVPSQQLGIELNGIFWHSESIKPEAVAKQDMARKLTALHARGARGLLIFEDEWRVRLGAVKGYIRSLLGVKKKIGARVCSVTTDRDRCRTFIEANHIQGCDRAGDSWGLEFNGEIIAAALFADARPSTAPAGTAELVRYCVGSELSVVGGLSRLIAAFRRTHPVAPIITYSDDRLSSGKLYLQAGFLQKESSGPRYWYVQAGKSRERHHRFGFRKDALRQRGWLREDETERECMIRMGYNRIWDAGKTKWLLPA